MSVADESTGVDIIKIFQAVGLTLLAGLAGALFKFWFDQIKERRREDRVLLYWVHRVRFTRSAAIKQADRLFSKAKQLDNSDSRVSRVIGGVSLSLSSFDTLNSKDLQQPIRRRLRYGRMSTSHYRNTQSLKYVINAEHNIDTGKRIRQLLEDAVSAYTDETEAYISKAAKNFEDLTQLMWQVSTPDIANASSDMRLRRVARKFYQVQLKALEDAFPSATVANEIYELFQKELWDWRHDELVEQMFMHARIGRDELHRLKRVNSAYAKQLRELSKMYRIWDEELGSWLVGVNE